LNNTEKAYLYQQREKLRSQGKWPLTGNRRAYQGGRGGGRDGNDRDVRQRIAALEARLPTANDHDDHSSLSGGDAHGGDDAASEVPSNRTNPALRQQRSGKRPT